MNYKSRSFTISLAAVTIALIINATTHCQNGTLLLEDLPHLINAKLLMKGGLVSLLPETLGLPDHGALAGSLLGHLSVPVCWIVTRVYYLS